MKKSTLFLIFVLFFGISFSQTGTVDSYTKISATEGSFPGTLDAGDFFATPEVIGDLDNDGFEDIAVGARNDNDGGLNRGAVWILFLNEDRSVKAYQKISSLVGNFTGTIDNEDSFGSSVTAIGDLDNDGVMDIGVGAWGDDDDATNSGAVWILFLNTNGTVKAHQKISATEGGLVGLTANRAFGISTCGLGDLDGDDVPDIAVGSPNYDNDGGLYRGCVWILFLNTDGTVKAQQKINDYHGNFDVILDNEDRFGDGLSNLGDIDDDGVNDIAAAAKYDDDGGTDVGAVYILFLNTDGTVKAHQKVSATAGGFDGSLSSGDQFGYSTTGLGDIDGDGVHDIAIGSLGDDDDGENRGAVWITMLNNSGTVKSHQKISSSEGNFNGNLDDGDYFGMFLTQFKTGEKELAVGALKDDDGEEDAGAVWILDLSTNYNSVIELNRLSVLISPNPSKNFINITIKNTNLINPKFQIYDISGKIIKGGNLKNKINISELSEGAYFIKVISKTKVYSGKFIKK